MGSSFDSFHDSIRLSSSTSHLFPPKNAKIRCTSSRLARVEDTLFAPKPLTQQAKAHPHLTLSASEKGVSRPRKDLSPLFSRSDSNSHALNSSRVWTCNPSRACLSLVNFLSRIMKAKISDAGNTRSHTRTHTPVKSLRLSYLKDM